MKKSGFTESQIVAVLKEGETGVAVARPAAHRGMDQPNQAPRVRGRCSVNAVHPMSQTP